MAILTQENLQSGNLSYYDYSAYSRGQMLFREGRVTIARFDISSAVCHVEDNHRLHHVLVTAETKRQVKATCTCPKSEKQRICSHVVASLMALNVYVEREAPKLWEYRLTLALENTPKKKAKGESRTRMAVVFGLSAERYQNNVYAYRLHSFVIKSDWPGFEELENLPSGEEKTAKLDADRSWEQFVNIAPSGIDHRVVTNVPVEGVQMLNLMGRYNTYGYGFSDVHTYLPLIAKLHAPLFLMSERERVFKERLYVLDEPVHIEGAMARDRDKLSLVAGLSVNGEVFTTIKDKLHVLSIDPAWMLAGRYVVPLENPEAINMLHYFPVEIPLEKEQDFREKYFQLIAERMDVKGDVVSWVDVNEPAVPRLYLQDDEGTLRAALRFGYGEYEVSANPKAEAVTMQPILNSWGMIRIHRDRFSEERYYQMLTDARYGLKRAAPPQPPGTYELRARTHVLDFLLHSISHLTEAGFEIYGEESLKSGRINRAKPTLSLNITSGIDWFDIQAVIHYGDQEVSFRDMRRALMKNERFIKLADGSIGQIPEEWVERYARLFDLAEETEDGMRVRDYHLPLVDALLENADQTQIAAEFQQRRNRLQTFEAIRSQPIPAGFTGELRPYQKAGIDWLYFLHEYGFGGCLADDMGLGKTIQMLAFLQLLKEQGKNQAASLLVVPKSILANWLREAERFTPGLRFMEYFGNTRSKDIQVFQEYDVVLTTYGTMLRDVELLRGYRFHYVILDESQWIKNPLAQSSKAARLLNAEHRLVMTGTPVENNTFELWSQFAFLNPGLLGSLDYFKRAFAGPIESDASEATAQLLRRLVYPFILRRTKEQVAPELPPRTERILYTDLEPAQRKLYNHTRDYYRGLLMGMIEDQGVNDVRMKILEGLLRLRQVCIHPSLIEPAYRGEAAKFEVLLETIETLRAEGHKALIFSQFVQTFKILRRELDARKIPYAYLDGHTADRQRQVDIFQDDKTIPFFLISLKAGGVGLNLTAADYVIHIDPWWNPAVEMQAADRAHRIGQDKPVFIYKIIARDTVEEKILQLQERKQELVEQLIAPEGSFFKSITKEDVKVLFS